MNRRDFIKQSIFGAIGLSLPISLSADLVIVDIKVLDSIKDALKKTGGSKTTIELTFMGNIWDYIRLIDEDGREWSTNDEGRNWHCGLMSFSLEDAYCEPA